MTLGDKIRKFRKLKGWTQKELGKAVGFSVSTADSRIRKYENNVMAPKSDVLKKLAEQLDVDISALSDISIESLEDAMQVLFFFEEEFGMKIERNEEKTTLSFDNKYIDKNTMNTFSSYLYSWYIKNKSINHNDQESEKEYLKWKGRFPRDLDTYWTDQVNRLDNIYDPLASEYDDKLQPIKTKAELITQIRFLIESGLTIESDTIQFGADDGGLIITFLLSELFKESNKKTTDAFARFLSCLRTIEDYGMGIYRDISTNEKGSQISYTLRYSPLMPIKNDIDSLNEFYKNKDNLNDFDIEMYETSYKDKLNTYNEDLSTVFYDII